jgi:hypothetical protein
MFLTCDSIGSASHRRRTRLEVRPIGEKPASSNKSVAAFAHSVRSSEHGAGAPRRQRLNVRRHARPEGRYQQ